MMEKDKKDKFLERSASLYHNTIIKGWEKLYNKKREYLFGALRKYHVPGVALELGSADGVMTSRLCKEFDKVTVVDGSEIFLTKIREQIPEKNIKLICSLFENFEPKEQYNTIFMTHILEHLDDPVDLLKRSKRWLKDNGHLLIAVPNADSLHRLIGVKLGMLSQKDELNEQDIILGHKRVYTPDLFKKHVNQAGWNIKNFGGVMVKPLSNRQIESDWPDDLVDAFFKLGEDLPGLCSEIYIVAALL